MRAASSVEDYVASPVGKYVAGPTYAVFWPHVGLNGTMFWGRPDEQDVDVVVRAWESDSKPVTPHVALVDARGLKSVDLGAFDKLTRYLASRWVEFGRNITRQALLRPSGLAGTIVAGFYSVFQPSYPVEVFSQPGAALEWLGTPGDAPLLDELGRIYAEAVGKSPLVLALRARLDGSLASAARKDVARALGVSERTLQRKLREAGTTLQAEINDAQVRAAQNLLLHTNYSVKRIALEVGCTSLQSFSTLFHKLTGESPSAWRSRRVSSG